MDAFPRRSVGTMASVHASVNTLNSYENLSNRESYLMHTVNMLEAKSSLSRLVEAIEGYV